MSRYFPEVPFPDLVVAGYVRRSSAMQKDNFSIAAQKRAICDECMRRSFPQPLFYEDDERSARGEQIALRPAFRRLLDDVQAGRVQVIIVHTLDRWSRNVTVTLQSFRILSQHQTAFISLSEHIDYSTPEGRLQLTILAAFAAYFSDMLAKHTTKGKGERAAQGFHNGDVPFGYRSVGPKLPLERNPDTFPGLRLIGELRMQGKSAEEIAESVNAAGYRTGSKRFGARLFTKDTVTAILRNEFYVAYAPGDEYGTVLYREQRYRGQHQATFTCEEWQKIRDITQSMHHARTRTERVRRIYELAGYVSCVHCRLPLRCDTGNTPDHRRQYYRDAAKARRLPCSAGGKSMVRIDLVHQQFGKLLESLSIPGGWREEIYQTMEAEARMIGPTPQSMEREKERLRVKRTRTLKQYREGYIDDTEFQAEMAAVELALRTLETSQSAGVAHNDLLAVEKHLPGMAVLWEIATAKERREMIMLMLEPGGVYYDLERKEIAAIKPYPGFQPILRMLEGIVAYDAEQGLLKTAYWPGA